MLCEACLLPAFLREESHCVDVIGVSMAERQQVQLDHQLVLDGLRERDLVATPDDAVRESNPIATLVRGVVDYLLDVAVLQIEADSLDLQQEGQRTIKVHREVAEGAPD